MLLGKLASYCDIRIIKERKVIIPQFHQIELSIITLGSGLKNPAGHLLILMVQARASNNNGNFKHISHPTVIGCLRHSLNYNDATIPPKDTNRLGPMLPLVGILDQPLPLLVDLTSIILLVQ
jgi:hypothetical protein